MSFKYTNLPDMVEMPEGYTKGQVRILILFFEELARSGKILQFAQFYSKYRQSNGVNIPMKEFQHFIDELPTKKTAEERKEIADQLFNNNDPKVKQIVDSYLRQNENHVPQTRKDEQGNVIQIYNRKESTPYQNGFAHSSEGDLDNDPDDVSSQAEEDKENVPQESSSNLDWLKQNDRFIKLFEKDDENHVNQKEPHVQTVDYEQVHDVIENPHKEDDFSYLRIGLESAPPMSDDDDQSADEGSRKKMRVENDEAEEKELSEADKEAHELAVSQYRYYVGINSGQDVKETWDFSSHSKSAEQEKTSSEANKDYQSLFQSFNDIISGIDSRNEQEIKDREQMEMEEQRRQDELEEERIRQMEEQRQLYEQQQREIEERIRQIEKEAKEKEQRELEESQREPSEEHVDADVSVYHQNLNHAPAVEREDVGVQNSSERVVNVVTDGSKDHSNGVEQSSHVQVQQGKTESIPKRTSFGQQNGSAHQNDSDELNASIKSIVVLYIKFIAALHKILKGSPEKIEMYDQFKQIHDEYQALIDRLIHIDEQQDRGTPEYNKSILDTIKDFYNGQQFLKILKQLKTDDSEFCKVLDFLLQKTKSKAEQIAADHDNQEARELAALMKERLESVQLVGKNDQTKVKELLGNKIEPSKSNQPNYEKLITSLNVVIKHFSKYDYLSSSSMHLEKYEKLQVKQPGKLCLFRDKMILIIDKKPKSETVFNTALKNVKVQQVVKNPSAPRKFLGRIMPCGDKKLVSDDEVEENAARHLLQVTQRNDKYRNTFRLQITSSGSGPLPDAKDFAQKFDKLSRLPNFQSLIAELEDFILNESSENSV